MAEALGVVASVLTLCRVVAEGVKALCRAPVEIELLQEEVDLFRDLVKYVQPAIDESQHPIVYQVLLQANATVTELRHIIVDKILSQKNNLSCVRRHAWLKNKSEIARLRESLQIKRAFLLEALSANLWISTNRVEHKLSFLDRRSPAQGQSGGLITDECSSQSVHSRAIVDSEIAATQETSEPPYNLRSPIAAIENVPASGSRKVDQRLGQNNSPGREQMSKNKPLHQRKFVAESMGLTDISSTSSFFYGESYTDATSKHRLYSYSSRRLNATECIQATHYAFFHSKRPRHWIRLSMTITVILGSRYWNLAASVSSVHKRSQSLPKRLLLDVEEFLRSHQTIQQDTHLSMMLTDRTNDNKIEDSQAIIKFTRPTFDVHSYLKKITKTIHHWNCPRYRERDLDQRTVRPHSPNDVFLAFFESRWVFGFRFGSEKARIDAMLYMLQAYHCLSGAPGINSFIGVVLDDETETLSGFICELPSLGDPLGLILKAKVTDQVVSWKRREKWCRQIVQGVASVHSCGFTVGCLGDAPLCEVAIDGHDKAVIYGRIRKTFRHREAAIGVVPPEYHNFAGPSGCLILASPETDIYQLGRLLWLIAAHEHFLLHSTLAQYGAEVLTNKERFENFGDVISLPSPGAHVPRYLTDIITLCRSENPDDRPSAAALLQMFPPNLVVSDLEKDVERPSSDADRPVHGRSDSSRFTARGTKTMQHHLRRLEDCQEAYPATTTCDHCGSLAGLHYFHCDICMSSDYDICLRCFADGLHCLDNVHQLRECSTTLREERLYTSVKADGKREVEVY